MLRNQMRRHILLSIMFLSSCKPQASKVLGEQRDKHDSSFYETFKTAAKSNSAFELFYNPIWLVDEVPLADRKPSGLSACMMSAGIQNEDDLGQYETVFLPKQCKLDVLNNKNLSIIFMNNYNSNNPTARKERIGKAFRLPISSLRDTPCKGSYSITWTKVDKWTDLPGIDTLGERTKKELEKLDIKTSHINKQTAVALITTADGYHFLPLPKICDLGDKLDKVSDVAAEWASIWSELVHTESSFSNDSYYFDNKLTAEPHSYWYRNYAKHYLDSKSEGNALFFQKNETAESAQKRIEAHLNEYANDSLLAKVALVPTIHLSNEGLAACFSMQTKMQRLKVNKSYLKFDRYGEWKQSTEKNSFSALTHYSFSETNRDPRLSDFNTFQIRYVLGRFQLKDRADEAAGLLPINGTEQGYPLCYREDGDCTLQLGEKADAQKNCESFLKELWSRP